MKEKLRKFVDKHIEAITLFTPVIVLLALALVFMNISKPEQFVASDIPTEYKHVVYLVIQDKPEAESETETPEVSDDPEATGYQYTEGEIKLIAQLTMAEAGNQSELGKRLVIDVVLNRVDHPDPQYPDTVQEVIYQKNQFSPIGDGRFEKCYATEENIQLVKEEIERRTDHDVIFFRTTRYSDYGVPMYCVGDHYFSSFS